jgi:hypothetical protein
MKTKFNLRTMKIFECSTCVSFRSRTNSNYGYCTRLKYQVLPDRTFCEADGILDPNLWFMQEPELTKYLKQEVKYKCKILPKHLDRDYYMKRCGVI